MDTTSRPRTTDEGKSVRVVPVDVRALNDRVEDGAGGVTAECSQGLEGVEVEQGGMLSTRRRFGDCESHVHLQLGPSCACTERGLWRGLSRRPHRPNGCQLQ